MSSHVKAVDSVRVSSRVLGGDVMLVARDDKIIEIYSIGQDDIEQYVGRLDVHTKVDNRKMAVLLYEIRRQIKSRPMSKASLHWLSALSAGGLLDHNEDPR